MDALTSETCWALNKEIKKQVTKLVSLYSFICNVWIVELFKIMNWVKGWRQRVSAFPLSIKWWNKKASDIKLVSLYSTTKMMHGPISIRFCTLCSDSHSSVSLNSGAVSPRNRGAEGKVSCPGHKRYSNPTIRPQAACCTCWGITERSSTSLLVYEKVNDLFRFTVDWCGRRFNISAFQFWYVIFSSCGRSPRMTYELEFSVLDQVLWRLHRI